jgi:Cupin-like domain
MTAFTEDSLDLLRDAYPETPALLHHRLADHPLLQLDALVRLATTLDPAHVEYNPGNLPIGIDPADIPVSALSVEETIRGIEESGSWMAIKFIENDPAYAELLRSTLAEIRSVVEPVTGEMMTLQGFMFVSSESAITPFHFDPEHNILLQIRGSKTFTIFPQNDDAICPPQAHEAFHLGEHHRNLPWDAGFSGKARSFRLEPGRALHVPVKAPHWVKVEKGPSVSLSVTWRSEWSYKEADARGLNRLLRKSGLVPETPGRWPQQNNLKSVAYRALRKVGLGK